MWKDEEKGRNKSTHLNPNKAILIYIIILNSRMGCVDFVLYKMNVHPIHSLPSALVGYDSLPF
jgi:hypothetical protein